MNQKSNQFECIKCRARKYAMYDRKSKNICECGSMMKVYQKRNEKLISAFKDDPFTKELRCIPVYEYEFNEDE